MSALASIGRILSNPAAWLAAATFGIALVLYAHDADGAFAIYDGAWYGHFAECHPFHSILPHHPLFHVIALGVTQILRLAHVVHPGHVAIRLVAGIGGALVLLQIARLAGPERRWAGAAFAFVVFATRGFIAEAATGENVLPAIATALLLLECAAAPVPSLFKVGAALAVAACMRQDSLFLIPGMLVALLPALPPGRRLAPVAKMVAAAGVVTLGFYLLVFLFVSRVVSEDLWDYFTRFGRTARWNAPGATVGQHVAFHYASCGLAIVGRLWEHALPHILVAAAWVAVVLVAMRLLRGSDGSRRFTAAVLVTIGIRTPFYAWFEPQNFEWQLLPMVLLAALGARLARGVPRTSARARRAGIAALALTGVLVLRVHAPNTSELRQRRFATAVEKALAAAGEGAYYIVIDKNAMIGVEMKLQEHKQLDQPYGVTVDALADLALAKRAELEKRGQGSRPIVVIGDRFIETGMPWDLLHAGEGFAAFETPPPPKVRIVKHEGKAFAAILDP
jgi:hypothetical protein